MFYVYILQSIKDSRTYVGQSNNTVRRLGQHNRGMVKSTRHRAPFRLLLKEEFLNLKEAKKRELWWKSGAGRKKLKEHFTKGFSINKYE